jgi:hypothetical protein
MRGFMVDPQAVDAAGARFRTDRSAAQRSIADQVQGSAQVRMNLGDVAAAADFQRNWYDWAQTHFEDLRATDDLITELGTKLGATARDYQQSDDDIAAELRRIGDALGGGAP